MKLLYKEELLSTGVKKVVKYVADAVDQPYYYRGVHDAIRCVKGSSTFYILDSDRSSYVVDTTPTLKEHIGIIEFSKVYSNVRGIRELSQCDILRPYSLGDYILHLSNPLPQSLKIYYARKYISLCEQYGCGYIIPVEILKNHLKELGLAP